MNLGPIVDGWTARPHPEPVTLTGAWVDVLPLSEAHFADLFATTCAPTPDLWTYRPIERPTSLATLWMHLAGVLADPGAVTFALRPRTGPSAGTVAGVASYLRIEPAHGQVEVGGILLGHGLARTAAGTEAIHLLIRHAFDDLGYRRFEWKCDAGNEPSRRAAARLGFGYEGTFRQHMVVKGRNRDTAWFSITDGEWPAIRAEHERWLAPDNFHPDGRQRTPLLV